jgi:hypothetical protein
MRRRDGRVQVDGRVRPRRDPHRPGPDVRDDRGDGRQGARSARRSGAAAAREAHAGEHAVVERRRSDAAAAHRPDLPGDRQEPQPRRAATKDDLERGTLTYPQVDTPPVVAVQAPRRPRPATPGWRSRWSPRPPAPTSAAATCRGRRSTGRRRTRSAVVRPRRGGLRAEDGDGRRDGRVGVGVHQHRSTLGATPTFAQFMTAVGAGYAEVWANSGRTANTLIMAPDRSGTSSGRRRMRSRSSRPCRQRCRAAEHHRVRGLNSGEIIVGDMAALLVAETPGAPVELRSWSPRSAVSRLV